MGKQSNDGVLMKVCRFCNIELIENVNWSSSCKKNWINSCKECETKRVKEYENSNPERRKQYDSYYRREINRKFLIVTEDSKGNKIRIWTIKRDYPKDNNCELCGRENLLLGYHHWDDEHPHNGMWVCRSCHMAVEKIEKIPNIKELYENLKGKIENDREFQSQN